MQEKCQTHPFNVVLECIDHMESEMGVYYTCRKLLLHVPKISLWKVRTSCAGMSMREKVPDAFL